MRVRCRSQVRFVPFQNFVWLNVILNIFKGNGYFSGRGWLNSLLVYWLIGDWSFGVRVRRYGTRSAIRTFLTIRSDFPGIRPIFPKTGLSFRRNQPAFSDSSSLYLKYRPLYSVSKTNSRKIVHFPQKYPIFPGIGP